ncbi:MAG: MFS transporter [Bacteroidota bacterium]
MKSQRPLHILPIIIFSQFACTSVWFAGNSVVGELAEATGFGPELIGYILSSVQFGFITGTLVFALLMVVDRFAPSRVFMICAVLAALCNLLLLTGNISKPLLLAFRFGTGFFLAGIYPVGMKIAADYFEKGLGKALGYLVGALVFGKAFPYLVKSIGADHYELVIYTTSAFAAMGGLLLWAGVPNGPYRKPSKKLHLWATPRLFKIAGFRKAALGYFGHMWELYAFWGFVAFGLRTFNTIGENTIFVPLWASIIIALGGISCIVGGHLSLRHGSKKVAVISLALSGVFCLLSPFLFELPSYLFLIMFGLWGMAVVADSPQFSSMVALEVPAELRGTALTLVNCIGFAISILSIELLSFLVTVLKPTYLFLILAIGPIIGLLALGTKKSVT